MSTAAITKTNTIRTAERAGCSIDYSDYNYENITLDGEYKQGGFTGKVTLDDTNGSVILNGTINTASRVPTFNFQASIDKFRPHALHLDTRL